MSTDIRVALVYEQNEGAQTLRAALANAGVSIAVECRASALDAAALLGSHVDAIVVNLDPELEELLDEVTDALDSAEQPVIFNDPAASSDLSGWDRARWMRHLAAKMKGKTDVTPPAPPGAQAIPSPLPKVVETAPATLVLAEISAPPVEPLIEAPSAVTAQSDVSLELALADLDLMFEAPPAEPAPVSPPPSLVVGDDLGDLDALFAESVSFEPAPERAASPATSSPVAAADEFDLDSLFADPPASVDVNTAPEGDELSLDALFAEAPIAPAAVENVASEETAELDLDALFAAAPMDQPVAATPTPTQSPVEAELTDLDALFASEPTSESVPFSPAATANELTDLDALFREFQSSQNESSAAPAKVEAASPPASPAKTFDASSLSLDWSLEPVEEIAPKSAHVDKLVAEWRLDAPSKPIAQATAAPTPVAAAPKSGPSPAIPAALEASLALADFKLMDDDSALSNNADGFGELGEIEALDLSSMEFAAPAATASVDSNELGLADLDFALDLDVPAPAEPRRQDLRSSDSSLGDLDSLFEPMAEAPLFGLSLPDLSRVYVLGASIGGPEAIKAFLSHLPATVPAAFIVAQHMGGEFLAMMATQLDAASRLSVRCPKNGERLRHGEVVVAPASEQLTIDDTGHLHLSAAASGSPYNPSIDHLVRDAANRFGDHATLILFSGMGSDAVEGGRYLTSRGGQVWAQERSTCVITSMIDSAKSQGLIRFEGTPAQLADRVLQVAS